MRHGHEHRQRRRREQRRQRSRSVFGVSPRLALRSFRFDSFRLVSFDFGARALGLCSRLTARGSVRPALAGFWAQTARCKAKNASAKIVKKNQNAQAQRKSEKNRVLFFFASLQPLLLLPLLLLPLTNRARWSITSMSQWENSCKHLFIGANCLVGMRRA